MVLRPCTIEQRLCNKEFKILTRYTNIHTGSVSFIPAILCKCVEKLLMIFYLHFNFYNFNSLNHWIIDFKLFVMQFIYDGNIIASALFFDWLSFVYHVHKNQFQTVQIETQYAALYVRLRTHFDLVVFSCGAMNAHWKIC